MPLDNSIVKIIKHTFILGSLSATRRIRIVKGNSQRDRGENCDGKNTRRIALFLVRAALDAIIRTLLVASLYDTFSFADSFPLNVEGGVVFGGYHRLLGP